MLGDHFVACPRTGLLPYCLVASSSVRGCKSRAKRSGLRVVPQQWLARTTTLGGEALCCDATLVSPLTSRSPSPECRRGPTRVTFFFTARGRIGGRAPWQAGALSRAFAGRSTTARRGRWGDEGQHLLPCAPPQGGVGGVCQRAARLKLNAAKTRVWNAAGTLPPGVLALAPDSPVWVGDLSLPPAQRGLVALGVPFGTREFVDAHLHDVLARQAKLLDALPQLQDSQVAWLLLSCCAAPRSQYAIRTLPLDDTRGYAASHDAAVLGCLQSLLYADAGTALPETAQARAQLALRHGGLGLRSAARHAPAAYWADSLRAIARRDAAHAHELIAALEADCAAPPALETLRLARSSLQAIGFEPPDWAQLLQGEAPSQPDEDGSLDLTRGWQRPASQAVDDFAHRAHLREADSASAALLLSQAGPHAARVFVARPTLPEFSLASPIFRVLLLRRLRLPLPLTAARCRCQARQDPFGDHRAACPRSGVLRARAGPLERAAARVCREAGATVALNVLVRDLNLDPVRQDDRRIEVIANGLPLWGGAQVAVDTTLVSPLTAAGAPRRVRGQTAGAALQAARRAKERSYPEFCRAHRCRLAVIALEVGGRWSNEAANFVRLLARCRARAVPATCRAAATSAFTLRWSSLISFAAARTFAASLLSLPLGGTASVDGDPPLLSEVLVDSAIPPPIASRLP